MAKKRKYKKSKKTASRLDIAVVTLIVLSILLAVLIYTKSGTIGIKLNEILGGIMGIMQYVLPIGCIAIAIKLASDGREETTSKIVQFAVVIVSLAIVFSVFQISSGELDSSKEMSEVVKDAYYYGTQSQGGGAIGAVGGVILAKLLGDVGAIIFCLGIAIILIVFTFGINLSDMINMFMDRLEEKREERFERKQELAKERKEVQEETPSQRRKRQREERRVRAELAKLEEKEKEPISDQIKINFGGRIVDGEDEKTGLKKYDHSNDDLEPLTRDSKKEMQPDVIENNLFKQEEEKKEDKKREVLQ